MNDGRDQVRLKWLTCLMFLMFAMTSDAVGSVIPRVLEEYRLSLKAASAFHYAPMIAIAIGALSLGFLADRLGRRRTIVLGLALYGASSLLFAFGNSFLQFVALLAVAGFGISIFKIGALALIGDISRNNAEHTRLMNTVEGFFGVGAIIGPAIVAVLLSAGFSWKWLYVCAAIICFGLLAMAMTGRYPEVKHQATERIDLARTLRLMRDRHAIGFSLLIMLYVAVEVAIYVWMPTYLQDYGGGYAWLPVYALTLFFVLRAAGRFLAVWLLGRFRWNHILAVFGLAIFGCFAGSLWFGVNAGAWLLPISGLFMSMIYPTLNSKGISGFRADEQGAVAGVILFFTAVAAAAGPLAMAAVSDAGGSLRHGFALATAFAGLLALGLLYNGIADPAAPRLAAREARGTNA
jgi:DHA1 family quinolone resistance protein-like MFS transporter